MNSRERLLRFVRVARVRAVRHAGAALFLRGFAVAVVFAALAILADAAFGLPVAARNILRWAALSLASALIAAGYWRQREEFRLGNILERIQQYFASLGRHDPLLNAWSFLGGGDGEGEIQSELISKELERGAEFAKAAKKRLDELYGWRAVFQRAGKRALAAFVVAPIAIAGTGAWLGPDTATLLRRFWNPYREVHRIRESIAMEPPPGTYRPLRGSSQTVRVRMKGQKPPGWGEPKIILEGETQEMAYAAEPPALSGAEGVYFYTAASLVRPLRMHLKWGEFTSEAWIFDPVALPEAEEIMVKAHPPAYAAQSAKTWSAPAQITVLEGSHLEITGRSGPVLRQASAYWMAEGRPDTLAALAGVSGKNFSFTATPQNAPALKLRLALTDEEGRTNEAAWVAGVEAVPDAPAFVSILEPMFSEVQMDVNEELPIAWEASDDVRLVSVSALLALQGSQTAQRRVLWKGQGTESGARSDGVHLFKPGRWALKAGDKAVFFLEAQDNYPQTREAAQSPERLLILITDFTAQHKENLEKAGENLKESLMSHLEQGLNLAAELESKDAAASAPQIQQYEAQSREIIRKLQEQAKVLEQDPLASPKWSWGMKKLAEGLEAARAGHLSQGTKDGLERYLQEMEKASSTFNELKKEQKMNDAVNSAQRLENLTERLENRLEDAKSAEELMDVLSDLDREFQELAKAMEKMSPEEYPKEFVNQMPPEDDEMRQMGDAKSELAEALRSGDMKRAKEAAKKMLEGLRKMRKDLEQASENYRKKPQEVLGSGGADSQEKKENTVAKDIESIKKSQEELLWQTSAVEQSMKKRLAQNKEKEGPALSGAEGLNSEERKALEGQSAKQGEILEKSRKALEELAKVDREYPTLMLSPLTSKMEAAVKAQEEAESKLKARELGGSLKAENEALKKLEELQQGLEQLGEDMAKMPSSGQGGPGGGGKPLMMIPGGMRPQGGGGERGAHLGPVRIPKPEDYKVPAQKRQEILKSLQEKTPRSMEQEVGEYLKSLLK